MSTRAGTVTRNTLWSTLDLALDFVLPLLTSILVARAMGPSKLGEYGYILWVTQMALMIGSFGVPRAAARYLAEYLARGEEAQANAVLRLVFRIQLASASLIVAFGVAWALFLLPAHETTYAALAIASVFPAALMGIAAAINSAREDFGANVLASIAGMITQATGVLLTLGFDWDMEGLAASLLLARTGDCVLRWALVRARLPQGSGLLRIKGAPLTPEKRREVLEFCWHATVLLAINMVVWNRSEMFFLKRFCDLQQVAFFSLAFTFANIPAQLAWPFSRAAVASLFVEQGRSEVGARKIAALMARYMSLIVFPTAVGLAAISAPLVVTLYGPQYAAAAPVLVLACVLAAAAPLAEPATSLVTVAGGQRLLVRWGIVAAVLTLTLDLWLVSWQCAMGGAVANGIGQLISTLGVWVIATRRFGLRLHASSLRSVGWAAGLVGTAAAAAAQLLPSVATLLLVPPLGALAYLVLLRLLKVLDVEDGRRFRRALVTLPRSVRTLGDRVVAWLVVAPPTPGPARD